MYLPRMRHENHQALETVRAVRLLLLATAMSMSMILTGCGDRLDREEWTVTPTQASVAVGEPITLTVVHHEVYVGSGEDDRRESPVDRSELVWTVQPSGSATFEDGVFTAYAPGDYTVGLDSTTLKGIDPRAFPAVITVTGEAADMVVFENHNLGGVQNGGTSPTFEIPSNMTITEIETYHWNDGSGSQVTGELSLRSDSGQVYGPWPTLGAPGQGGVPNAYWKATPEVKLPAGSYTIVDSDPSTWSQNAESGGQGMVRVYAEPVQ